MEAAPSIARHRSFVRGKATVVTSTESYALASELITALRAREAAEGSEEEGEQGEGGEAVEERDAEDSTLE